MKALRRLVVRVALPEQLRDLRAVMQNLRWAWHRPTRDLFASIDPTTWASVGHNPVSLLAEVSAERLDELCTDREFLDQLADAKRDLDYYLTTGGWYADQQQSEEGADWPKQIAYLSPEFGIVESLPQYSGGLGILAGDHLKTASDLGVPIIGVGLLYRSGYFNQSLSADGWQLETYPVLDPRRLLLSPVRAADGTPVLITIDLPHQRTLHAEVWLAQVGRVPLLLLDSDVPQNAESERAVTDRLYGGGKEQRIAQELLLGVGGVRAIRAFCEATGRPQPEVFHTNEGHAGFQGLERLRELTTDGSLQFDEALQVVRASTVFTTHTPVPAGIDRFEKSILMRFLGEDRVLPGVPLERVVELGSEDDPQMFNMAHLGLRLAQRSNGVSALHGRVSRGMFRGLWPQFAESDVPITSVTNGVHAPTWLGRYMSDHGRVSELPDEELWYRRNRSRTLLVDEIRRRVRISSQQRGMSPAELGWIDTMFDPDVLTIGFARRVPSYKRLTLMLRDPQRLRDLLLHPEHPVQIVLAGKSHPADDGGKELIRQMVRFCDDPEVRHRITFLPDYDMGMARYLYTGCDVWLNNPLRPLEACGTSGMKAALNGGLNLSILDGWWDEMYDGVNGWAIPSADGVHDSDRRDDLEAQALYQLVESQVAPLFYERNGNAVPHEWIGRVRHTLRTLGPQVDATRMLREYLDKLYIPSARASAVLAAGQNQKAREFTAWINEIRQAWPAVMIRDVQAADDDQISDESEIELGATLPLRAIVRLPGLTASDVSVQLAVGEPGGDNEMANVSYVEMAEGERVGDDVEYTASIDLDRQGTLGYAVRVVPKHLSLSSAAELGLLVTT